MSMITPVETAAEISTAEISTLIGWAGLGLVHSVHRLGPAYVSMRMRWLLLEERLRLRQPLLLLVLVMGGVPLISMLELLELQELQELLLLVFLLVLLLL